ncbi:MAG: amidase [Proteobacteria bacterium]|nr:amidase [Pseudomonadota bacterium]
MDLNRRDFLGAAAVAAVGVGGPRAAAAPAAGDALCDLEASAQLRLLATRAVSAQELMQAHLERIARWNPTVNAIVARTPEEECLALARAVDERRARGEPLGPLAGLPWAFKDLEPVVGQPWTRGSPVFRHATATADSLVVERLKRAGVVPIGRTNSPEFGMGSHTYNPVYGTTRNPYDPSKSAGGSSGGAGVGLATGMLALADGSDLGGSLRNPANFNNVVGFRPTVGLVPTGPSALPFYGFAVKGPMARTVADAALLLGVLAGADPRDPGVYESDPAALAAPLGRDPKGTRVAWCPDLGGLPLEPAVRAVLEAQRPVLESLGCVVEEAVPPLAHADEVFLTLRALRSFIVWGGLLEAHRAELKPEAVGEIEAGSRLGAREIGRALTAHAELMGAMRRFHERHDAIACAVNQLAPFDAALDWPHAVAGRPMSHYIEWMQSAYWFTATWQPAISVPAGFTPGGLPVGLQLVGRYRGDRALLELAHAFEQATRVGLRRPALPA